MTPGKLQVSWELARRIMFGELHLPSFAFALVSPVTSICAFVSPETGRGWWWRRYRHGNNWRERGGTEREGEAWQTAVLPRLRLLWQQGKATLCFTVCLNTSAWISTVSELCLNLSVYQFTLMPRFSQICPTDSTHNIIFIFCMRILCCSSAIFVFQVYIKCIFHVKIILMYSKWSGTYLYTETKQLEMGHELNIMTYYPMIV